MLVVFYTACVAPAVGPHDVTPDTPVIVPRQAVEAVVRERQELVIQATLKQREPVLMLAVVKE